MTHLDGFLYPVLVEKMLLLAQAISHARSNCYTLADTSKLRDTISTTTSLRKEVAYH